VKSKILDLTMKESDLIEIMKKHSITNLKLFDISIRQLSKDKSKQFNLDLSNKKSELVTIKQFTPYDMWCLDIENLLKIFTVKNGSK
jgi:hypothetical protein